MGEIPLGPTYSDSDPHFTPRWLSEKLVGYLPETFSGTVVDPACGAGNLLVAAAVHLGASSRQGTDLRLMGIDVSKRAVRACKTSLSTLLPNANYAVEQADFLAESPPASEGATAVVMNPPFKGYGRLTSAKRRHIARLLEMKGRFNLSYAFVQRAVTLYRPTTLISLLPSNWVYSRASSFRAELNSLNGSWDWEDVGDDVFKGLNVDVGILVWRPTPPKKHQLLNPPRVSQAPGTGLEVRYGVATGRDALFIEIAKSAPRFGKVMSAVRGRDIARKSGVAIWIPFRTSEVSVATFKKHVTPRTVAALRTRSCVISGRRRLFEYHDPIPEWFIKGPKLLIPEISVGQVRVELDSAGTKLPLHSVIAVRVPSITVGRSIREYLMGAEEQKRLLTRAPRLSGGATRLQVDNLREVLESYHVAQVRKTR